MYNMLRLTTGPLGTDEGVIACDIRVGGWKTPKVRRGFSRPAALMCTSDLQVAKLRLILCFLHSDRLTEQCPLVLVGGCVTEIIAACFGRVRTLVHREFARPRSGHF